MFSHRDTFLLNAYLLGRESGVLEQILHIAVSQDDE